MIFVHKNCRRDFTDIKRSFQIPAPREDPSTKRLRSSMSPFSWENNCFLCCKLAIEDERHPDRNPFTHATTIDFLKTIVEKCQERKDDWGSEVEIRLSCSRDLVADEGVYHKECLTRLMSNRSKPSDKEQHKVRGRPEDGDMMKRFEELCNWLDSEADAELYTVHELQSKMSELANGETLYGIKWLKQKLKYRYDSIYFAEISGRSDVVCFRDMATYILSEAWYNSRKEDKIEDAERIITAAAKLIMADIRQKNYDMDYYPTHNDIVSPEEKGLLPKNLKMFLQLLVKSEIKRNSIGQSIIYAARPRSIIPQYYSVWGLKWIMSLDQNGWSMNSINLDSA